MSVADLMSLTSTFKRLGKSTFRILKRKGDGNRLEAHASDTIPGHQGASLPNDMHPDKPQILETTDIGASSIEAHTAFKYQPILTPSTIRVIALQPGSYDSAIRCTLSTFNLDTLARSEQGLFETLSYVWGDALDRREIFCDDIPILITKSLFEALQVLRYPTGGGVRLLWADGICINQSDKVEKSHQVLLMSRIYSCGSNVVIWLGHADKERVYVALGLVCQLAAERVAQLSHLNPGHPPPHYLWYADKRNKYIKVVPEEARFDLKAQRDHLIFLAALFSAPWFERVWVIQEFVMSSSAQVFWGNASIRFDLLGEAAVYVGTEYAAFSNYSASIGLRNCWNMYHLKYVQGEQSFWEVFRALRDRKATDPRDQVYALLGLPITDRGADGWFPMRPDYTLSTADVFHTVARKLLVERQVIDVLISVAHGKQFREGWASWVPDWSDMRAGGVFRTMDVGSEPDPPSDINIPQACSVCITNCHDSISLKGFVVDVVQTLAEDFFADKKIITRAYKLRPKLTPKRKEWVAAISAYATTYQGIFDEDTLALTLTGGFHLEDDETTSSEVYNYLDDYRNFLQYAQNPTESYSERIINYFNLVINTIARRRFFITEKGSLGLGPAATEKGDVVAIFFGASVPFVLRPSGEERHWRLVGGCYVHDVVGREAVDGWREIGELATEFHLF